MCSRLREKCSQTIPSLDTILGQYPKPVGNEVMIDPKDRDILRELQRNCDQPIEALAAKVHLSRNACWRRMKILEDEGVIRGRVALVDSARINLGLTAFIAVKTAQHEPKWLEKFSSAVKDLPEII